MHGSRLVKVGDCSSYMMYLGWTLMFWREVMYWLDFASFCLGEIHVIKGVLLESADKRC